MAARFGRSSPDPWLGSVVELDGGHLHRSLNLIGIGKTLARERIAAEEPPPAFLLTRANTRLWE